MLILQSSRLTLSYSGLCLGFCLWFCLIYVTRVLIKRPKGMHCKKKECGGGGEAATTNDFRKC